MKSICGIYKIENKFTGEIYIGQSTDCFRRFNRHCHNNFLYIDRAIKANGIESYNFEIIHVCKKSELDYWEKYYIWKYRSYDSEIGCNADYDTRLLQYFAINNKEEL